MSEAERALRALVRAAEIEAATAAAGPMLAAFALVRRVAGAAAQLVVAEDAAAMLEARRALRFKPGAGAADA